MTLCLDQTAVRDVDNLVRSHLPLVGHLVREVMARVPAHVNRDDLTSAAMFALAASARSFDPAVGTPFASFAGIRIRGALTDELRSMDWVSRSIRGKARELDATRAALAQSLHREPTGPDIADAMGVSRTEVSTIESHAHLSTVVSLDAPLLEQGIDPPSRTESPEALLLRREQLGFLRDAVAELPERLRLVVEQYFFQQRKMAAIAADLGVTESRVSQMRSQALKQLRAGLVSIDDTVDDDSSDTAGSHAGYAAAVAARSSLAERLAATTLLGEQHAAAADLDISA